MINDDGKDHLRGHSHHNKISHAHARRPQRGTDHITADNEPAEIIRWLCGLEGGERERSFTPDKSAKAEDDKGQSQGDHDRIKRIPQAPPQLAVQHGHDGDKHASHRSPYKITNVVHPSLLIKQAANLLLTDLGKNDRARPFSLVHHIDPVFYPRPVQANTMTAEMF